jgi:glycosyltransferase involved in cell wall biosynthesis
LVIRLPIIGRGRETPFSLALNYLSFALVATIAAPFLLRGRADVIFVYQPSPLTVALPAIVVSWVKRIPLILWVQDLWPESLTASDASPWPITLRLISQLARFVYRRCSLILVQSRAHIEPIQYLAPKVSVRYFPNSADSQFRPFDRPPEIDRRLGLPRGFKVLFGGNIGAAQDFATILSAAEKLRHLPEIQWVIVGEGRRKGWVRNEIVERKLGHMFHLLDQQPTDLMPYYFAAADGLLVTLSRSEGAALTIPSKVQAYLACGRPIIAAIAGEGAKIVIESGAGLTCEPGNPAALAEAVLALYNTSSSERASMGKAGRRYFEQEFDQRRLMDRLGGWLTELKTKHQTLQ